jgi:hypothetical protein
VVKSAPLRGAPPSPAEIQVEVQVDAARLGDPAVEDLELVEDRRGRGRGGEAAGECPGEHRCGAAHGTGNAGGGVPFRRRDFGR